MLGGMFTFVINYNKEIRYVKLLLLYYNVLYMYLGIQYNILQK